MPIEYLESLVMCCSQEDDAAVDLSQNSSGLRHQGAHKRNLSNGTTDATPLRRSKRQKPTINLEVLSSQESLPARAKSKKPRSPVVKTETRELEVSTTVKHTIRKLATKKEADVTEQEADIKTFAAIEQPKATKRRKKTREEKQLEAMPLAARAQGLRMFVGAHVSAAKGKVT